MPSVIHTNKTNYYCSALLPFTASCTRFAACFPTTHTAHLVRLGHHRIAYLGCLVACRHIQPETRAAPFGSCSMASRCNDFIICPHLPGRPSRLLEDQQGRRKPATSTRRQLRDAGLARHGILTQDGNVTCQRYFVAPCDFELPLSLVLRDVVSLPNERREPGWCGEPAPRGKAWACTGPLITRCCSLVLSCLDRQFHKTSERPE